MRNVTMNKNLCSISALALAMGVPVIAVAQEGGSRLEEIIVTAERRSASLQEVPVSVSALTTETLENRMVAEAEDIARFVPSLKMTNNITTPTSLSPSMRGSLVADASVVVAESPFGIYVDDVYIARLSANNVALADIERVDPRARFTAVTPSPARSNSSPATQAKRIGSTPQRARVTGIRLGSASVAAPRSTTLGRPLYLANLLKRTASLRTS